MSGVGIAEPGHGRFRWTIAAFIIAGGLIASLVVWQLYETAPGRWCQIAKEASESNVSGCYSLLLKLLDIKDHAIIGLMGILAVTVLSVVVVALGVNIKAGGPGGVNLDVGANETTLNAGDTHVTIPTPPSGEGNNK
jgi:hypothetical protein